jgi:acyl-CoA synthetase (AMP-forming)/AMP-acid ligase II/thioesterase domain-containing protein/acyl carrier protein
MISRSSVSPPNIRRFLEDAVALGPDVPAILAPGRPPLTYGRLLAHVDHTIQTLNILGLGRNDRIGIVVPEGPELAVAFLAVAAGATCVPLNPAWRSSEFDRYLPTLKVKAVVVQSGLDSEAGSAARARGIPLIELRPTVAADAGIFTLCGDEVRDASRTRGFAEADDIALVLPTSGTTSKPKVVPLTQSNLCVSASNVAGTLRLTRDDCCLNLMPLFHIHGIVGVLLSSLAAGARVVCTPGFSAPGFFDWMDETSPSWYSAVPTLHQKILTRAPHHRDAIARARLRFIRSCSAPLAPAVMTELERVFRVPVIEAYGMTEASHQVASNPLPPGQRKAGSVGMATGVDIAIVNDRGERLAPGVTGEILVRGASVTRGYEGVSPANDAIVPGGWFRTGDQGRMDADGYLFLTGRTKEIINRGGEKISPREIDDVLAQHPSVAQATAFAVPDDTLGEDVGVAVVLREGATLREAELREFVAMQLADFKIPRRVVFVDEIPLGPTGKPLRIGLAEKLGLSTADGREAVCTYEAPLTALEHDIIRIWEDLLGVTPIGRSDDFFRLGGHSLLAVRMVTRIETTLGVKIPRATVFGGATVEHLAQAVFQAQSEAVESPVVAVRSEGARTPFYFLHGQYTGGGFFCRELAGAMGGERPFYTVLPHGLDGKFIPRTIEAMAEDRLRVLIEVQPTGPYMLGGYCNGGLVALEMARRLEKMGRRVDLLVIVDAPARNAHFRGLWRVIRGLGFLLRRDRHRQAEWFARLLVILSLDAAATPGQRARRLFRAVRTGVREVVEKASGLRKAGDARRTPSAGPYRIYRRAVDTYVPGRYRGRVALFRTCAMESKFPGDPTAGWDQVTDHLEIHTIAGDHMTCLTEHVEDLAKSLAICLNPHP